MPATIFRPLAYFAVTLLFVLTVSRLGLAIWLLPKVGDWGEFSELMFWGLRLDIQLIGVFSFLLATITIIFAHGRALTLWRVLLRASVTLIVPAAVMLELATPSFLLEYGVRPNRLFYEYLDSPKEVGSMLLSSRLPMVVFALVVLFAALFFMWNLSRRWVNGSAWRKSDWLIAPLLLVLCFGGARGTSGHRPLNPASAAITSNAMLNDLPMSSLYSLAYAAWRARDESSVALTYGYMPDDEVLRRVRKSSGISAPMFVDDDSTQHWQIATGEHGKAKNYVLILMESLGAEFVGSLGGQPLTPELDALAKEGMNFTNLYATGTRSVRGIEATTTGYLPSPARAVIKLPNAQKDFYTIANTFNDAGYHSQFIYGGNAHFDNMRRFLANNGFAEIIDGKDFSDDAFRSSWGVADEYVFDRLHNELMEATEGGHEEPRFTFAFTSTNHEPFEHPMGRVAEYNTPHDTVENAVQYTDWALGQFFAKAKKSPYWDNTVFLVVADHNSRVYGDQLIPIERFHIPAMFLGGGVIPQQYNELASQIDLPVTALSLVGIDSINPMLGRDLTSTKMLGRSIMQFRNTQAYRQGDHVVVLQPEKAPTHWSYQGDKLVLAERIEELEKEALAHAIWANKAYVNNLYASSAWDKSQVSMSPRPSS
jgi:phosphoglycerol transferase MdoB-like AlkP superfamily enzyme